MIKIAVASGKGGTGKTFVSTNLFFTLLKYNYRAQLADCDAEAPNAAAFFKTELTGLSEVTQMIPVIDTNACIWCEACKDYCNYNAIFILPPLKIIKVIEELCHGCGACTAACRHDAITEIPVSLGQVSEYSLEGIPSIIEARINIGVMSPVKVIKAAIKKLDNSMDIAILDSPPGTSCPFIHTVSNADYVILVTEPTPFGLSDLKQSVETIKTINKPCGVIINRAGLGDDNVNKYLSQEKIPLLAEIPYKKEIAQLYSRGIIVTESDPTLEKQILTLAETIILQYGNSSTQR
jgi:MinD superfamily P-loop ATPase